MVKTIRCEYCKKNIKPEDQRVTFLEHIEKPKKIIVEKHFHAHCWIKKYEEEIEKRITNLISSIKNKFTPFLKALS